MFLKILGLCVGGNTCLLAKPAMAAGLASRPMTVLDLATLLESEERKLENGGRINREHRT